MTDVGATGRIRAEVRAEVIRALQMGDGCQACGGTESIYPRHLNGRKAHMSWYGVLDALRHGQDDVRAKYVLLCDVCAAQRRQVHAHQAQADVPATYRAQRQAALIAQGHACTICGEEDGRVLRVVRADGSPIRKNWLDAYRDVRVHPGDYRVYCANCLLKQQTEVEHETV